MTFSAINMHISDESADDVNSPTAYLMMRPCTELLAHHGSRRKRDLQRSDEMIPGRPNIIEFPLHGLEITTVNQTTEDKYGMLYHLYNITKIDPLPIQLSFYPLMDGMVMYASLGNAPTPDDFIWESKGNETLFIPSGNLTNNDGMFWVGVGFEGNCYESNCLVKEIYGLYLDIMTCRAARDCSPIDMDNQTLAYQIQKLDVGCRFWNVSTEAWSLGDCEVCIYLMYLSGSL